MSKTLTPLPTGFSISRRGGCDGDGSCGDGGDGVGCGH
jgi:hypothetical protein